MCFTCYVNSGCNEPDSETVDDLHNEFNVAKSCDNGWYGSRPICSKYNCTCSFSIYFILTLGLIIIRWTEDRGQEKENLMV